MASIGVWPSPRGGICIPMNWRSSAAPCGGLLGIEAFTSGAHVALNFNGRGKVGFGTGEGCGGSDAYVFGWAPTSSPKRLGVDVWSAYIDGVWTSSVVVDVYIYHPSSPSFSTSINAYRRSTSGGFGTLVGSKATGTSELVSCGTVIKASITVNSDGTVSVA